MQPPKPNLADYPEIPPGCLTNYNETHKLFQVYRNIRVVDPKTGKRKGSRETIGSIRGNVFKISSTYALKLKNQELESKLAAQSEQESAPTPEVEDVKSSQADAVGKTIDKILDDTKFDKRNPERIEIPMLTIALGSMMCALGGYTACNEISEAITNRIQPYFRKYMPELAVGSVSHDTVRNTMLLVDTKRFDSFYREVLSQMPRVPIKVLAADGQAVKATGHTDEEHPEKHGCYMLMNFYDQTNRICLSHTLIDDKENEISVGPDNLRNLNIEGAVVTADAMSCQVKFVEAVLEGGAHYCISLKGNQEKSFLEVMNLFNTTPEDRMIKYEPPTTLDHGRIENNKVALLRGSMLSKILKEKWPGLPGGSIVRIIRTCIKKTTKQESYEERYFITSIPARKENVQRVAEAARAHWGIENRLHWCLDMRFSQDHMQANHPHYVANRSALNKMAMAFLEHYRFWLWDTGRESSPPSVNIIQQRCLDPATAMECLACGMGLIK